MNRNQVMWILPVATFLSAGCSESGSEAPPDSAGKTTPQITIDHKHEPEMIPRQSQNARVQNIVMPEKEEQSLLEWEKKLDAGLIDAARQATDSAKGSDEDNSLQIVLIANEPGDLPVLRERVNAAGGTVQSVFRNRIYMILPTSAIESLAREERVWSMQTDEPGLVPLRPESTGTDQRPKASD